MANEVFPKLSANGEKLYEPIYKFNKLAVEKAEELANIELASLREYTEIGLTQLRAATEVSDFDSFKGFADSQQAAFKKVSEKVINDAKAFAKVTESFRDEAIKIAREGSPEVDLKSA